MATIRQKTSFGPGKYRGIEFTKERLKRFADGTNAAIKAGVPIPLLELHAPINANDKATSQFAQEKGAGWITKVGVDNKDGSLWWEAKDVPAAKAEAIKSGTDRFTSPEFRESYDCEKAGVYTGPIIRHIAFTAKPGNPHQGAIEAIALSERAGVYQFSEGDRDDAEYKAAGSYPEGKEDAEKDKEHGTNGNLGSGSEGKSVDKTTLENEDSESDEVEDLEKNLSQEELDKLYETVEGSAPDKGPKDGELVAQHAEKPKAKEDEVLLDNAEEGAAVSPVVDVAGPEQPPLDNAQQVPMEAAAAVAINPDMPPVAVDRQKIQAILAGLAQKNIVLPSDFDFAQESAVEILLAAINSSLKAEQEAQAEVEPEMESPPVQESSMPFSERDAKNLPEAIRVKLESNGRVVLSFVKDSAVEQFSEDELASLSEKVRTKLIAAIEREKKERVEAEQKAIQFAERERVAKNGHARDKAVAAINKTIIPPALKEKLIGSYCTTQFSEGVEPPTYTAQAVAEMVANALPPALQFEVADAKEAEKPEVTIVVGKNTDGSPTLTRQKNSEQFFESDDLPSNHISAERAEELYQSGPFAKSIPAGRFKSITDQVRAENVREPNGVKRY